MLLCLASPYHWNLHCDKRLVVFVKGYNRCVVAVLLVWPYPLCSVDPFSDGCAC